MRPSQKRIAGTFDKIFQAFFFIFARRRRGNPSITYAPEDIKTILVIELWGIGDLVLAMPALESLRSRFPAAQISLLAKHHARDLLRYNGAIDEFIIYDFPWTRFKRKYSLDCWDLRGFFRLIRALRRKHFDLVLDARGDIRNNFLSFLIRGDRTVGYADTGGGYFLTDVVRGESRIEHRADRWRRVLSHIGVPQDSQAAPRIRILEEERLWAKDFLKAQGARRGESLVGVHPGAATKVRCWPLERFAKVAEDIRDRMGPKVLFFISPDGYGQELLAQRGFACAKVSLRDMILLINEMDLFICNDSGPMHIAAALDVPLVALFGPGDLRSMGPLGQRCHVVIKDGYSCRPCYDYCKFKESHCLESISVQEVIKEVGQALKGIVLERNKL